MFRGPMTRRSIYRSDEGREAMARWYDRFLERLGPDAVEPVEVDTRYGRTNVLVGGPEDAPELWCFHGAMANAAAALAQIPQLLTRFRVFFPDIVGQPGRSDERRLDWQGEDHGHWLIDVLDAMEREAVTALGVSLGGYVVLRAASLAPERISRAVLWAPGGLVKPPLGPMFGLIWRGLAYSMAPSRARLEGILERTFSELDDDYVDYFADSLKHVHPDRRFPNTLKDGALADWRAPVMLLAHGDDTVFPAEPLVARARELIPHLDEVKVLPGLRHMPPFDPAALEPIVADIRAFAERE